MGAGRRQNRGVRAVRELHEKGSAAAATRLGGGQPVILFASKDIDPLQLATRIVWQRQITYSARIIAVMLALAAVSALGVHV